MRAGLDATTLALYLSGEYDVHLRLKVQNGSGTFVNLDGRYTRVQLRLPDPVEPIGSMQFVVVRDSTALGPAGSLAPLVTESTWNRLDDGVTYSPLLQLGRVVTLEVSLTAIGAPRPLDVGPPWYEIYRGIIARVDWPEYDANQLTIETNGLAAVLQHAKSEAAYVYEQGTSIEQVARDILDNNGFSSVPINFPVATGKVLPNDYAPGLQKTVWDQLKALAQSMGWVVYYRYTGTGPATLTFFAPARDKVVADHTVNAWDFTQMSLDEAEVRSVGYLVFVDETGAEQMLGPEEDLDSIAKYGGSLGIRRPFWIKLDEFSPIRDAVSAQAMLQAALSDVADPDIVATAQSVPLVFGESGVDLYSIPAKDRFFTDNQTWALFSNAITFAADVEPYSSIGVRGVPTAGMKSWKQLGALLPGTTQVSTYYQDDPPSMPSLGDLWIDTDDGNRRRRWDGSVWVDVTRTVVSTDLADSAVTTPKINNSAVVEAKIANNAVTQNKILNGAVIEAKIANSAVTTNKLFNEAVTAAKLGPNAVIAEKIAAGAVTQSKVASGLWIPEVVAALPTLPNASYPNGAIVVLSTNWKLYRNANGTWTAAVATGDLSGTIDLSTQVSGTLSAAFAAAGLINSNITINADGTLSGAGGGQVSLSSLPGAISLSTQVSGTLSAAFADAGLINSNVTINADGTLSGAGGGQVSLPSLPGQIVAGQIAANAVTTEKLNALAVTTAKLDALAVTTAKLATGAVEADKIAANAVTTAKLDALAVTAAKIAAGAVTTVKLDALAVTADKLAANAVTAAKISAGAVGADAIAARSISATKLFIGSFDNLVMNGSFEQFATTNDQDGWRIIQGVGQSGMVATIDETDARTGNRCLRIDSSASTTGPGTGTAGHLLYGDVSGEGGIAVNTGDRMYAEWWIKKVGPGTSSTVQCSWRWYTAAGNFLGISSSLTYTPTEEWQRCFTPQVTVPEGAFFGEPDLRIRGAADVDILVDDVYARRMVEGSIIVDGTLTARHIEVGTLTGDLLVANTITGDKIASRTIGTGHLFVGSFDNLAPNPGFEQPGTDGLPAEWHLGTHGGGLWSRNTAVTARSGNACLAYDATGQTNYAKLYHGSNSWVEVAPGDKFYAEVWIRNSNGGTTNTGQIRIEYRDSNNVLVSGQSGNTVTISTTWQKSSVDAEVPAGATRLDIVLQVPPDGLGGVILFDDVYVRRKLTGELIVDGTITAEKLDVTELSAITANLGTVTAGSLEADVVVASESFSAEFAHFSGAVTFNANHPFGAWILTDNGGDGIMCQLGRTSSGPFLPTFNSWVGYDHDADPGVTPAGLTTFWARALYTDSPGGTDSEDTGEVDVFAIRADLPSAGGVRLQYSVPVGIGVLPPAGSRLWVQDTWNTDGQIIAQIGAQSSAVSGGGSVVALRITARTGGAGHTSTHATGLLAEARKSNDDVARFLGQDSGNTVIIKGSGDLQINGGALQLNGGARITGMLVGTVVHDFGTLANFATDSVSFTVTGATVGDLCFVSLPTSLGVSHQGFQYKARVTASNTVTVYATNTTGGSVNLTEMTFHVLVVKVA